MIARPLNDAACLDKVTQEAARYARRRTVRQLSDRFETTDELADWIRSMPQRNDDGDQADGPRIGCGAVTQRLRLPAEDPNCVERSALYLAVAESIDPEPIRQLATISTPAGKHTFPLEDEVPVILDPDRVSRNALDAGVYLIRNDGGGLGELARPAELLGWIADIAEEPAAAHRNGLERIEHAREAMEALLVGNRVRRNGLEDIGFTLAVAQQAAALFGGDGTSALRLGALALERLARRNGMRARGAAKRCGRRNLSIRIGKHRISPDIGTLTAIPRALHTHVHPVVRPFASAYLQAQFGPVGALPELLEDSFSKRQPTAPKAPPQRSSHPSLLPLLLSAHAGGKD